MNNLTKIAAIKLIGEIMTKPDSFEKDVSLVNCSKDLNGSYLITIHARGKFAEFADKLNLERKNGLETH